MCIYNQNLFWSLCCNTDQWLLCNTGISDHLLWEPAFLSYFLFFFTPSPTSSFLYCLSGIPQCSLYLASPPPPATPRPPLYDPWKRLICTRTICQYKKTLIKYFSKNKTNLLKQLLPILIAHISSMFFISSKEIYFL